MIRSVLVANRGEIAVRVMRTCQRLGIRTVAVYSDADRASRHVRDADEAYRLGPPPALESYLNQAAILAIAAEAGVEAIHPGYGFLAENADFAEAVLAAGLIWIGPPPAAMRMLGEKAPAKALAQRLGVPVLPGYHGAEQDLPALTRHAAAIGYPLLIKASAGGGGRGMRIVRAPEELSEALESAQREARASFANDQVLLERYVTRPRHVEVQIMGDSRGNVIHLGERECSLQRRHQKLIEESPSPAVDADLRARMGASAVALARAAGYQNAGTVEFLMDESGSFYFLELNARLQVEHPVTEMVTGLDLVELQLQVASGEPLLLGQEQVHLHGHAIEARIIAEDPEAGFLPSTGVISQLRWPAADEHVRIDSGFDVGTEVTPYYDSLLAKLIVSATDRAGAVDALQTALRATRISGPSTNAALLLAIAEHREFRLGNLHTGFLEDHRLTETLGQVPDEAIAAATVARVSRPQSHARPWQTRNHWRLASTPRTVNWQIGEEILPVILRHEPDHEQSEVQVRSTSLRVASLSLSELQVGQLIARVIEADDADISVIWSGRTYRLSIQPPPDVSALLAAGQAGDGALAAPMPGRVVKLHVQIGDTVQERQPLLVLEAMKMEHIVTAPHAGTLGHLHVALGDQVTAGTVLAEIEP